MKHCPTCQRAYPDTVGDICPNDAAKLVYASSPGTPYDSQPQWQPPPSGWGYPPSGQYVSAPPPTRGGGGLSTIALINGICATVFPLLAYSILSSASRFEIGSYKFSMVLIYLTIIMGLTAINLGIVAICLADQNSARKTKGIVGLCLGILPFFVLMILALSAGPRIPF